MGVIITRTQRRGAGTGNNMRQVQSSSVGSVNADVQVRESDSGIRNTNLHLVLPSLGLANIAPQLPSIND